MNAQRVKRGVRIALAGVLVLFTLLGAILGLLLYHPAAPQWMLGMIRSHSAMTIEVEGVEGRLAGPLAVRGLRLEYPGLSLRIETLDLDWRPSALLTGELHLYSLSLADVNLALPADESSSPARTTGGFEGLVLPLSLRLDELLLSALIIERQGADPLKVERMSLKARSREQGLEIQQLTLALPQLTLDAKGLVGLTATLPVELGLKWRYAPEQRTPLVGEGDMRGDLHRLRLRQTLNGALSGELEAGLNELSGALSWDVGLTLRQSDLTGWLREFPLQLNGSVKSHGTLERIGLQADLNLTQPDYGKASVSLRGEYVEGRFLAERLQVETGAGSRLEASGHYRPDDRLGSFDGLLRWQALRWPLQGDARLLSPDGRLEISGRPEAYDYTLSASLEAPGQPATKLDAAGGGDLQGIRLEALSADMSPGRLRGQGRIEWRPAPALKLQLQGEGVDPSHWLADFPGTLNLDLKTAGRMHSGEVAAEFQIQTLKGRLRGYPVEAGGRAELNGQILDIEGLRLSSGANRVELDGTLAQRLALQWRVDAPQLEAFWPGLQGSLRGNGRVEGTRLLPRIEATLSGQDLTYAAYRAGQLQLAADLSLAGDQTLSLDLRGERVRIDDFYWEDLKLRASGTLPQHRLALSLSGASAPLVQLKADALWSEESLWQGRLQELQLALPGRPAWRLVETSEFTLGATRQRLDELCLAKGEARICGGFKRTASAPWDARLRAQRFPLDTLTPFLPTGLNLTGTGDLEARLAVDAEGSPKGQADLRLPAGLIGLDLENEAERLDFAGGEAHGRIDDKGAELKLDLPLAGLGEVEAELTMPGFDPAASRPADQKLQGRLSLSIRDLSRISLISPRLQNPQGAIAGDFTLEGSLQQPRLLGTAALRGGAIDIPDLGLELRDIELELTAPRLDQLALRGGLKSGNGRMQLEGELDLDAEAGFPARARLTGHELKVANLPQAEVEVNPDLSFERDHQESRLDGTIEIPYARLRPRKLPSSAVSVTPDLVVVGVEEPQQRAFDPRLSAKLQLVLGDRVSFDGFGLRGQLSGRLLVIDEPKRPVIGRGRIGISKGTYRAYGQDLSIERGFALFADSPVDNPGLDVRAVRKVEEVTAGVRVGGTLKSPKIDLFSSPAMGESDILSYLLTGRPAGEGGGEAVGVAAALKATGAGTVAEELGRQFGLEELRLDTGSTLEEASVVAGTYLSPRLYVQYINELASRETKLRLRYDINRRLQLEAETGKTQAGDLYYTFDR